MTSLEKEVPSSKNEDDQMRDMDEDIPVATFRGYEDRVSVYIYVENMTVKITDARKHYGKYHKEGDQDAEIGINEINGTKIDHGMKVGIHATGRKKSPTGTDGSFVLRDAENDEIIGKVEFNNAYQPFTATEVAWNPEEHNKKLYATAKVRIDTDTYEIICIKLY